MTILLRKASCLRQRDALSEALGICDRVLGGQVGLRPRGVRARIDPGRERRT